MQYEISFFIKIHIKFFHIQRFKCETPLLFFLIKAMIYRQNYLQKKNVDCVKIIELHPAHSDVTCNLSRWSNGGKDICKKEQ